MTSKFLPAGAAVRARDVGGFSLVSSTPERAILECLLLAPERMDLVETYGLLENLRTLRPQVMQSLLEACSSVEVKRLFLFMAERAGLPVAARLARDRIDLGKGARSIVSKGAYVAKYEIVVPRSLVRCVIGRHFRGTGTNQSPGRGPTAGGARDPRAPG